MVGQIARGKDAGDRCLGGAGLGLHIAAVVGFQHILDQFRGWCVTNRNEHTLGWNIGNLAGLGVFDLNAFDAKGAVCAIDFVNFVEP